MATNTFDPHGADDLDDLSLPAANEPASSADANLASDVIRAKLVHIYSEEPEATQELAEAAEVDQRSKHQQFMYGLGSSGKDLATIQTEWHKYYEALPDSEKHVVWQEFYDSQSLMTRHAQPIPAAANQAQKLASHKNQKAGLRNAAAAKSKAPKLRDVRSPKEVQAAIRHTVTAGGQLNPKHHLQSLLFGLGMGLIVVIIFLFGFFNEVIIAPFIQPSRVTAATPLIVSSSSVAANNIPEVIIPKINVEIPADYTQTSTNEAIIENALESGIVHYPTTAMPGQAGNAAFFGHSSNNIFNKGKYKFAFVLLHTLVPGDTFYLSYNGKVYAYKVISRTIVEPSQVGVLGPVPGQTATATLITCDPPGTSLHRLVVVGQQISPDPAGNAPAAAAPAAGSSETASPPALPGNGPTLLGKLLKSASGKVLEVVVPIATVLWILRWINKKD